MHWHLYSRGYAVIYGYLQLFEVIIVFKVIHPLKKGIKKSMLLLYRMGGKKKILQELQVLTEPHLEVLEEKNTQTEQEAPEEEQQEENPDCIQAVKEKKPRTQKQIDAFKACLEIKRKKAMERKGIRDENAVVKKVELEEKIVKKAVSIKKKQLKQQIALDAISDDDTPIEELKVKKRVRISEPEYIPPPPPLFIFR